MIMDRGKKGDKGTNVDPYLQFNLNIKVRAEESTAYSDRGPQN